MHRVKELEVSLLLLDLHSPLTGNVVYESFKGDEAFQSANDFMEAKGWIKDGHLVWHSPCGNFKIIAKKVHDPVNIRNFNHPPHHHHEHKG